MTVGMWGTEAEDFSPAAPHRYFISVNIIYQIHLTLTLVLEYDCFKFCLCFFFIGFDNNGVMIGPRSTRQSNPEEHASHYFNTFSKDMLVQVRFHGHGKHKATTGRCFSYV